MIRKYLSAIFILFVSAASYSQGATESFQAISTTQTLEFLKQFQFSPTQSLLRIRIENTGCSGSVISKEGHILTALHCIRNCLIKAGALEDKPGHQATFINKAKAYEYTDCQDRASNSYSKIKIDYIPANGWVFLQDWMKTSKKKQIEFIQDGLNAEGMALDFAIIRILDRNTHSCVKINPRSYSQDEKVWSISYPLSAGGAPQFTVGKYLELDLSIPYENNIHSASIDAETGSSGSGLLDSGGQLRGLTVRVDKKGFSYEYGSTRFIPISYMMKRIRTDIGEEQTFKIINCH